MVVLKKKVLLRFLERETSKLLISLINSFMNQAPQLYSPMWLTYGWIPSSEMFVCDCGFRSILEFTAKSHEGNTFAAYTFDVLPESQPRIRDVASERYVNVAMMLQIYIFCRLFINKKWKKKTK